MTALIVLTSLTLVAVIILAVMVFLNKAGQGQPGYTERIVSEELRASREESSKNARELREEIARTQKQANDQMFNVLVALGDTQKKKLDDITEATRKLEESSRRETMALKDKVDLQLKQIRESNEAKLDQIRQTVDEKLQSTLEKRLGESFKLVSERLEAVHKGLGDMQNLAAGVGDLKRVLTNVKERGTWGEYQLAAILEDILTPDQYTRNFKPKETGEVVEFAIKLPGKKDDEPVWLPIDAKFPKEDYERLVIASQAGDAEGVKSSTADFFREIEKCAKDMHTKYISPPRTTDFAVMFLPTEGLFAEVLRKPGFHDLIQQKYRVIMTGPTTLSAILNSLRIGFHTLAIEQRASEVWNILSAVKTEFGKFGDVLDKVKKQLQTATKTLDETGARTRKMQRHLNSVTSLPGHEAEELLKLGPGDKAEPELDAEETASSDTGS